MTKLKKALLSKSLFRQCYIICLFACNVSYVHYIAYAVLALMVIWGSFFNDSAPGNMFFHLLFNTYREEAELPA